MNIMESFSDELNMILYGNIEVKNAVNRIKTILKTREDSINNTTNRDNFFSENGFTNIKLKNLSFSYENKIVIYPGYVVNSNNSYCSSNCLNKKQFSKVYEDELEENIPILTELIGNICCVDYKNEFVIDGNGDFYKCWNEIGLKDKVIRKF